MMHVSQLMTSNVITLSPDQDFLEAIRAMSASRISCLVVVQQGKPVGIITERDVVRHSAGILLDQASRHMQVQDFMTSSPACVQEDCDFESALSLSRERKIRHLPVVCLEGTLVGIVTQTNLLDAHAKLLETQQELQNSVEQLTALSLEDSLMQIGNRRAMEIDLSYIEAESARHDRVYSLSLVDVDYFKCYNDHYGHQLGDQALQQVADIIKATVRESDRVFRYGGEELLILMPATDLKGALQGAERIRMAIEDARVDHQLAPSGVLTVSCGVASNNHTGWHGMVEVADKALYDAKEQGRNRVACVASQAA